MINRRESTSNIAKEGTKEKLGIISEVINLINMQHATQLLFDAFLKQLNIYLIFDISI